MRIEPDFIFSANCLQTYLNCPRRYELKYPHKQSWPAAISEPILEFERHLQLGSRFHQLAFQYLNGIPENDLVKTINDSDLNTWFQNLLSFLKTINMQLSFAELAVKVPVGAYQAVAVFDLLAVTPDMNLLILDWKSAKRIPRKDQLAERIQTMLYPFAAFESVQSTVPGFEIEAENLQMSYLFVRHNHDNLITFEYNQNFHEQNRKLLENLIMEISAKETGAFECTTETRRCKYCNYRSLCERGVRAGDFRQEDEEPDLDQIIQNLDFETQDEIAF